MDPESTNLGSSGLEYIVWEDLEKNEDNDNGKGEKQRAEQRKAEIRKIPEQLILSEVRQMVEEMKAVNKQLEDTEAAINEYFKPVDKQAEMIVEMKLQEEEKTMKQMMQAMKAQALLDSQEAEKNANLNISKEEAGTR